MSPRIWQQPQGGVFSLTSTGRQCTLSVVSAVEMGWSVSSLFLKLSHILELISVEVPS